THRHAHAGLGERHAAFRIDDPLPVEPVHGRFGDDDRVENLAVLDLLRDDNRRGDSEDHLVPGLISELDRELFDRMLYRTHAEHADVGRASHACNRDQRYREGSDPAETSHCLFSLKLPDDHTPARLDPPTCRTTHPTSAFCASLASR